MLMYNCMLRFLIFSLQDLAVLESMQLALDNVVNAIFDGSNDFTHVNAEVQLALCRTFEGYFS